MFGLAALLGFDLLPRIRNWADLNFYRPSADTGFEHIDSLFGDNVIDWGLIETHWPDLLRTAISISEGRLSSVTLLRRLGNNSRKNRLYRAFRELGRGGPHDHAAALPRRRAAAGADHRDHQQGRGVPQVLRVAAFRWGGDRA